ncbi:hypothetical protein F5Y16DRAFT_406752 [Xylariaceae sp. FL0255]|nr:hypothetical protein F5Y16DRAFT_406752 [Xylariaceae sp. FL0255]
MDDVISLNRVSQTDGLEEIDELRSFTAVTPTIAIPTSLKHVTTAEAATDPNIGVNRRAHITTTVKAHTDTLQAATTLFLDSLGPIKALNDNMLTASIILEPLPVSLLEKSESQGNNTLRS